MEIGGVAGAGLQDAVTPDYEKIAEVADERGRGARGKIMGWQLFVRIKYQECECCYIFFTCWKNKSTSWEGYDEGGFNGLYQNKKHAYQDAEEAMKWKLRKFNRRVNK